MYNNYTEIFLCPKCGGIMETMERYIPEPISYDLEKRLSVFDFLRR